jgi:hypothetical protein
MATVKAKVISSEVENYRKLRRSDKARVKAKKSKEKLKKFKRNAKLSEPILPQTPTPEVEDPLEVIEALTHRPKRDYDLTRALMDVKHEVNRGYLELVWSHFPAFRTQHNLLQAETPTRVLQEQDSEVVFIHRSESEGKVEVLGVRVFSKASELFPHKLQLVIARSLS